MDMALWSWFLRDCYGPVALDPQGPPIILVCEVCVPAFSLGLQPEKQTKSCCLCFTLDNKLCRIRMDAFKLARVPAPMTAPHDMRRQGIHCSSFHSHANC